MAQLFEDESHGSEEPMAQTIASILENSRNFAVRAHTTLSLTTVDVLRGVGALVADATFRHSIIAT